MVPVTEKVMVVPLAGDVRHERNVPDAVVSAVELTTHVCAMPLLPIPSSSINAMAAHAAVRMPGRIEGTLPRSSLGRYRRKALSLMFATNNIARTTNLREIDISLSIEEMNATDPKYPCNKCARWPATFVAPKADVCIYSPGSWRGLCTHSAMGTEKLVSTPRQAEGKVGNH